MAKKKVFHFTEVLHHQHVRKRINLRKFEATLIDRLVFIAGPLIPIAIVPTVYNVWVHGATDGIALPTWIILSCTSFVMANYAILHRDKLLLVTYIPLFLLNVSVVIGYFVM